ncbi:MAG: phospho-N-acetylmuramoyl-pentapeptide-transferase [Symbiobacteriaceae bacterium]|nr:phospho-N-acetylmuramoyl-pentapeptide-transferase [Symbiobacteriaceae bacterium]
MFIALGCGLVLGPWFIRLLRQLKFRQTVRSDGPQTHLSKTGTPTMGGILIWSACLLGLTLQRAWNRQLLVFIAVILGHGLLGFLDDYIKAIYKNPEGLAARWKLLGQFALATLFYRQLLHGGATSLYFPWLGELPLGILYPAFALLYMVFFSNAVNYADGIDGLCGGLTFIFTMLCVLVAREQGETSLVTLGLALGGGILSFLAFNLHPAKLFMGDTGSLGLGAALAGFALLLRHEIALLLAGILFLVEMLSSIMQVSYFKYTRIRFGTGKRIFRMAPYHHHLELGGWSEWRVVLTFWGVALGAAAVGYLLIMGG